RTMWKPLAVVSGLLVLLTYLFIESRSPDLVLRARTYEALQALALHDAELTRDVLLARAGLLANYDSLAATERRLRQTLHSLRHDTMMVSDNAARDLDPEVDALTRAVQDKLTLVEYFKSDNALLRNSSTYFTHAGQQLAERLSDAGPATAAEIT